MLPVHPSGDSGLNRLLITCMVLSLGLHATLLIPGPSRKREHPREVLEVEILQPPAPIHSRAVPQPSAVPAGEAPPVPVMPPRTVTLPSAHLTPLPALQAPSPSLPPKTVSIPVPDLPAWEGMGGVPALERGAAGQDPLPSYLGMLRGRIEAWKTYPISARRRGREGTVLVRFMLKCDGVLESLEVAKSSGHVDLDEAARRAVQRAAPFPAPPCPDGSPLSLAVPISFDLTP